MTQTLAVPPHTALLRDFVNSHDVETGEEALPSAAALTSWLRERELVEAGARAATSVEHDRALRLREALRAAMIGNHEPKGDSGQALLDAECAAYPLRVSLRTGAPALEPVDDGVDGALARIVCAIIESDADGTWPRLKVCPDESCQCAFVDTSKNRSRTWCTMRVCGNRSKTRSYRARRRASAHPG